MFKEEFLDRADRLVNEQEIWDELENYTSDIRRGIISSSLSFLAYVQKYCDWRIRIKLD